MTKKKQIDVSWKTNSLISEQYQRTYRWLLRLKAYREGLPPSPDPTVAKDYLLSLATSCHSLRDWAKSDSEKWKIIEEYVEVDLFLKVCRDISNISKHKTLSRPSIDENIAILEARSPDQTYSIAVHFTNGTLIEAMRQSFKRAGKYDEQTFLNSLKKAKLDPTQAQHLLNAESIVDFALQSWEYYLVIGGYLDPDELEKLKTECFQQVSGIKN